MRNRIICIHISRLACVSSVTFTNLIARKTNFPEARLRGLPHTMGASDGARCWTILLSETLRVHGEVGGTPGPLADKAPPGRALAFLPIGVLASIASSCARSLGRIPAPIRDR